MNKSFKVVFNKARGALMVVNEVTSSVQAKGTKTVIATAVALVAGAAVAAPEISTTPDVDTTVSEWVEVPAEGVITTDKKIDWADVKADGQYHYKNNAGQPARAPSRPSPRKRANSLASFGYPPLARMQTPPVLKSRAKALNSPTRARSTSRPTRMASSGKMKRSLPRTMPRP